MLYKIDLCLLISSRIFAFSRIRGSCSFDIFVIYLCGANVEGCELSGRFYGADDLDFGVNALKANEV